MPRSKPKRAPAQKAIVTKPTKVAKVAKVTKTKAKVTKTKARQKATPLAHRTPPPIEELLVTEITSSPPQSAQSPKQLQSPSPPPDTSSFQYNVIGIAITTSNACIYSDKSGPWENSLCSLLSVELDLLAGVKRYHGIGKWEVQLKMAWLGGRRKRGSEQASIIDIVDDWPKIEEILQLQIQRGFYKNDSKNNILPVVEIVYTIRKLSTLREDVDTQRALDRRQRRTPSQFPDQLTSQRAYPLPDFSENNEDDDDTSFQLPLVPRRSTVTTRREAEAPAVLQRQIETGNRTGIIARHLQCSTKGCGNETHFCYKQGSVHYRVVKSQVATWSEHYELGIATPDEPPAGLRSQLLLQRVNIDGRRNRQSTSSQASISSSGPSPIINNYLSHPSYLPSPQSSTPSHAQYSTTAATLFDLERFSSPPGTEAALIGVRLEFFEWLRARFSDELWSEKVHKLGVLARTHEWDFTRLRSLSDSRTRAYEIAFKEQIADGILQKMNQYTSEFKRQFPRTSREQVLFGTDLEEEPI